MIVVYNRTNRIISVDGNIVRPKVNTVLYVEDSDNLRNMERNGLIFIRPYEEEIVPVVEIDEKSIEDEVLVEEVKGVKKPTPKKTSNKDKE